MADGFNNLPADIQERVLATEANKPANRQVELLGGLAQSTQLLIDAVQNLDKGSKTSQEALESLLGDIKSSLVTIGGKKAPKTPDYSKPVVKALERVEKALEGLEFPESKPEVNVEAPRVTVDTPKVDTKNIEKLLKTELPKVFQSAISKIPAAPELDLTPLLEQFETMQEQLASIDTATRMKPVPGSMKVTNPDGSNVGGGSSSVSEWASAYGIDKEDSSHYYFGSSEVGATNWRIQRLDKTTYAVAWATGSTDGATNWTNRTSLTYVEEL